MVVYSFNSTTQERQRETNVGASLFIAPDDQVKYFDIKAPFDIYQFLMTPSGMMMGFTILMIYCMSVMPDAKSLQEAG